MSLREAREAKRKRQERMTQHRLTRIGRVERVLLWWVLDLHGGYRNLKSQIEEASGNAGDSVAGGLSSEDLERWSLESGTGSCSLESASRSECWLLESVMSGLASGDLNRISTTQSSLCLRESGRGD